MVDSQPASQPASEYRRVEPRRFSRPHLSFLFLGAVMLSAPAIQAQSTFPPDCPDNVDNLVIQVWAQAPAGHEAFRTVHEAVEWANHCGATNPTFQIAGGPYNGEPSMTLPAGSKLIGGSATHQVGPCPGGGGGGGGGGGTPIGTAGGEDTITYCENFTFTPGPKCAVEISGDGSGPIFLTQSGSRFENLHLTQNTIGDEGAGIWTGTGTVAVEHCCFTNLIADRGGAIFASETTLSITDSDFMANTGKLGGGAICQDAGTLTVSDCVFIDDDATATTSGGALRLDGVVVDISGSEFTFCDAGSGGAILFESCTVTYSDNPSTSDNLAANGNGGAIEAKSCPSVKIKNSPFVINTASGDGGAIAVSDATDLDVEKSGFERNFAGGRGGAVSLDHSVSNFHLCKDGQRFYRNFSGQSGGAIYALQSATKHFGTQFVENNTGVGGGAIFAEDHSIARLDEDSLFQKNYTAQDKGGAILAEESTVDCFKVTFEENSTQSAGTGSQAAITSLGSGGALALNGGSTGTTSKDTVFKRNHAARDGGGAHVLAGSTFTVTGSLFEQNDAKGDGGGLSVTEHSTLTATGAKWIDNHALVETGGGLHVTCDTTATLTNCEFRQNDAVQDGGGLFLRNAKAEVVGGVFEGNESRTGRGGAIYHASAVQDENLCVYGKAVLTVSSGCQFNGNRASKGGGGVCILGANGKPADFDLIGSTFSGNTAGPDPVDSTPAVGVLVINGAKAALINPHRIVNCEFSVPGNGGGQAIRLIEQGEQKDRIHVLDSRVTGHDFGLRSVFGNDFLQNDRFKEVRDTGLTLTHCGHAEVERCCFKKSRFFQIRVLTNTFADIRQCGLEGGPASEVGISVDAPSHANIKECDISGHTKFGVEKRGAGHGDILAIDCWWGAASGPKPTGTGDRISAHVIGAPPKPAPFNWCD